MKVINLNSKFELTQAQISFAESVIICGEDEPIRADDSISILMNKIPIFLVDKPTQKEFETGDLFGFYQHSSKILGATTPVIGLCIENIIECAKNEDELIILIAIVLIHEFAHAKMRKHPNSNYSKPHEFYDWMEEPMANSITLEYFRKYDRGSSLRRIKLASVTPSIDPFNFVKDFISHQPDNYRLGLDLYEHGVGQWWMWRNNKNNIEKKVKEKQDWLIYTKNNVGKCDHYILNEIFNAFF